MKTQKKPLNVNKKGVEIRMAESIGSVIVQKALDEIRKRKAVKNRKKKPSLSMKKLLMRPVSIVTSQA